MSDFNVVGKIEFDAGKAKKELSDLSKILEEQKKIWKGAEIGSKEYQDAQQKIKETTEKYNKIAEEQNVIAKKQAGSFGTLKQGLNGLAPGLQGATTGVMALGKQMWLLVANPIGAVVAAIVGVFALLYNVLKGFDPVMDAIEQGFAAVSAVFNTLLDGVLSLITGAKSLGDVFGNLGGDIKEAAKQAVEFTKAQQDLDDSLIKSTVNQAKYNKEINELLLQSKDRSKTEAERIALIDKALDKETEAFKERKSNADKELAAAQNKIISEANLNKAQQKALREKGVDYAISLKDSKRLDDQFIKALAEKLAKQEDIENQSIAIREKAQNRRNSLADDAKAKSDALDAAKIVAQEKANTIEAARYKKRKELRDEDLKNQWQLDTEQKERDALKATQADQKIASDLAKMSAGLNAAREITTADNIQKLKDEQAVADAKKSIQDGTFNNVANGLNLLRGLFEKNKALQKALLIAESLAGIAKVVINTKAANAAARLKYALLPGGIALGAAESAMNNVSAAIGIAANIAATAKGLSALGGGSVSASSLGSSGGTVSAPLSPQQSSTSLNASSIQSVGNAAQGGSGRSFVLESDISNNQERQARLARAARLS